MLLLTRNHEVPVCTSLEISVHTTTQTVVAMKQVQVAVRLRDAARPEVGQLWILPNSSKVIDTL